MAKTLIVAVRTRGWLLGGVALAVTLSACGDFAPDGAEGDDDIAVVTSEIQRGTRYGSSAWGRGAVRLDIWSPRFNAYVHCSGQVVSKQTILTAAHCVLGLGGNPAYTTVRAWMQTGNGVVNVLNALSQVRFREDYTGLNPKFDVGLITAPSADLLKNVASRDAAYLAKTTLSGVSMVAVGYGYSDNTTSDGLGRLATIVPTYDSTNREYTYRDTTGSMPRMCEGDSGGPLKNGGLNTEYGVMSIGGPTSDPNPCRPQAYWATTADNIDWLRGKISGTCTEGNTIYACW
jgi:hypothetical protein